VKHLIIGSFVFSMVFVVCVLFSACDKAFRAVNKIDCSPAQQAFLIALDEHASDEILKLIITNGQAINQMK
jgi:hypothetical protein